MIMIRNEFKKIFITGIFVLALTTSLVGCQKKNTETTKQDTKEKVTKVVIGSGSNYNPYCYLDKNVEAVGYEYDVLKEINKLLPWTKWLWKNYFFKMYQLS